MDIEQQIKNYLVKNKVHDYEIEISPEPFQGNNLMGSMTRVEVRAKNAQGDDTKTHLVVKNASVNKIFRNAHATKNVYLREIYTYEKILPSFLELQKRYNVPVVFESYPEYCASSTTDLKECIVMKNLISTGYRNYDRVNGFDFDHASMVIKELGKFHALSFALRKKNFEAFCEIRNNARDIEYQDEFVPSSQQVMDVLSTSALKSLDEKNDKVLFDKFDSFRKNLVDVIKGAVNEVFDSEHAVITHGDCWVSNYLFKYQVQDGQVPYDVVLLDWQFTRIGSPVFDISQFLFICCDKEVRNKHYTDLIDAYYGSLTSFLRFFDEDANKVFPYNVLLEHLKKYSVLGLATTLRMKYFVSIDPASLGNWGDVDNLQEFIGQFFNAKRNESMYNETMRDVILDYINFGYNM